MKIELMDIHKTYGKQEVLKGISITMENGVYGLLGKNGAGKTTLIRSFSGWICSSLRIITIFSWDF